MRDISGEALKFKYIDLSLDCNDIGVQVIEALESLAWFIKEHEKHLIIKILLLKISISSLILI